MPFKSGVCKYCKGPTWGGIVESCVKCKTKIRKAWEVNWKKRIRRRGQALVWARNPKSWQMKCRQWHWTAYQTLQQNGIKWARLHPIRPRYVSAKGYVTLNTHGMTEDQLQLCDKLNLWQGRSRGRRHGAWEHQVIAAQKYGGLPQEFLVRHLNGDKTDNRPENLVLGTKKQNSMDHKTAVLEMMYWRQRALEAEGRSVLDHVNSINK